MNLALQDRKEGIQVKENASAEMWMQDGKGLSGGEK